MPKSSIWVCSSPFSRGAARWTSPVGPPLSNVQSHRGYRGSSCRVKRGVAKELLKERRAVCTEPLTQRCWCQCNTHVRLLRLPSETRQSYKDEAQRGNKLDILRWREVFAKPPRQKGSWTSLFSTAPEEPACARHRRTPQTAVSKKLNPVRANQTLIKVSYIIVSNAARA